MFEREGFADAASAELVAHFAQRLDAAQDVRGVEDPGQPDGVFFAEWEMAGRPFVLGQKNVCPEGFKHFHHAVAFPDVGGLRPGRVTFLELFEPLGVDDALLAFFLRFELRFHPVAERLLHLGQ